MENRKLIDFQKIFDTSPIGYYTCDNTGKIKYYNDAAARFWGRKPVVNKEYWCGAYKVFHRDGRPINKEEFPSEIALLGKLPHHKAEVKLQQPDGSIKNILQFTQLQYNKSAIIGCICTLIDISQQYLGHVEQERFSAIVDSSDDAIISKDLNGIIQSWNRGAEQLFGYSATEAVGKHITMLIPQDRLNEEERIISEIKKNKRLQHFETIRINKSGKEIPFSITVSPVKDAQGIVVGASKIARDISHRNEVEEKQAMLSAIVESSDDAIISKNLEGHIMSWNQGAQKIFGYSEKEVLGKPIAILIPKDRIEEEKHILSKLKSGEKIEHFQTIRKHKSGKELHISLTVSPIKKESTGEIIGASKVARDITQQVESQLALKKYAHNLETLNKIGKSISENLNLKEILQRVTDTSTKLTGASYGAFFYHNSETKENKDFKLYTVSGTTFEAFEKLNIPGYTKLFKSTFEKKQIVLIDNVKENNPNIENSDYQESSNNSKALISYLSVPVISKSGNVLGGLIFGHPDKAMFNNEHILLIENIAAQAAVSIDNSRLFERVKSLSEKKDEFIALASHELKTPLTTIKGYLQLLSKKKSDNLTELFTEKALKQVKKLNTLIEDILNMSRIEQGKLDLNLEKFDLRELLREVIETFTYSTTTHVINSRLGEQPVIIEGDQQRIEQVVINLMTNAIKYSPSANAIYVKLEVLQNSATVRVRDEGIGLTPAQKQNLFTRFYRAETTKGINGLGLGLYLTKQIIDLHKGRIDVSSEYGKGSEFYFTLPSNK